MSSQNEEDNCWLFGEGPSPNSGDIACWFPNVTPKEKYISDGEVLPECPEGKACFEVPDGLRGPRPGDLLCWSGKGKFGPSKDARAVWEAKSIEGEDRIKWEGRELRDKELTNVYTPSVSKSGGPTTWTPQTVSIKRRSNSTPTTFKPTKSSPKFTQDFSQSNFDENTTDYCKSTAPRPPPTPMKAYGSHPFPAYPQPFSPECFGPRSMPSRGHKARSTSSCTTSFKSSCPKLPQLELCDCDIPLPYWMKKKKHKKKEADQTPICAVTCGDKRCAANFFKTNDYKCVPISKGYLNTVMPPSCCFVYSQTIFDSKKCQYEDNQPGVPTYSVNMPSGKPQLVQMVKPPDKLVNDEANDSFLLNLAKKDWTGKTAELNLSFKIPKVKKTPTIDEQTQFRKEDLPKPDKKKKRGKSKGKRGKSKGKRGKSRGKSKGSRGTSKRGRSRGNRAKSRGNKSKESLARDRSRDSTNRRETSQGKLKGRGTTRSSSRGKQ